MEKTHLYNAKTSKVRWFVQRFGAREILLKPIRTIFAPLIIPLLSKSSFTFKAKNLELFYHRYNMTWASERCVEVPIANFFLKSADPESTLEIGNVLSHYEAIKHDVLDKFEVGPGVINEDILTYNPSKKYRLIVSISTFEHIGFDDAADEPSYEKIPHAVQACNKLLITGGKLILTVPIGYNPHLDKLLQENRLDPQEETYLKKFGPLDWRQVPKAEALQSRYKTPFPYANAIGVLEIAKA